MALIPMEKCGGGTLGTPEEIGTITVNGTTYTKYRVIVDFGTLPNNDTKTASTGVTNFHRLLSLSGVAFSSGNWGESLPLNVGNLSAALSLMNQNTVRVVTNYDATAYSAYITIEYY